jgi:hypothetical protein
MKSEQDIREEIKRIRIYREKWPCSPHIQRECDLLIDQLMWVVDDDQTPINGR